MAACGQKLSALVSSQLESWRPAPGGPQGLPTRSSGRADSQRFPQSRVLAPGAARPALLGAWSRVRLSYLVFGAPLSLLGCLDPSGSGDQRGKARSAARGCSELDVFPQSICEREVVLPPGCADINPLANNKWINNNKV